MINLYIGNTNNAIYCTPDENSSATITFYYFKFVNRITQDVVQMWLQNISGNKRNQKFLINVNTYFLNQDGGLWRYTIQSSLQNIVPTSAILESGLMYLHSDLIEPVKYNEQVNTFKTYNG
jgi:hypothetical protein